MAGKNVVKTIKSMDFDADELASIKSFEEAQALVAQQLGGQIINADEVIGDGFARLENKDKLIGVQFLFINWDFNLDGEFGEFVFARLITKSGEKYRISDGGSGIRQELWKFTEKSGIRGGLMVKNGLRKSEYPICAKCGVPSTDRNGGPCADCGEAKRSTGTTYYLDTSA